MGLSSKAQQNFLKTLITEDQQTFHTPVEGVELFAGDPFDDGEAVGFAPSGGNIVFSGDPNDPYLVNSGVFTLSNGSMESRRVTHLALVGSADWGDNAGGSYVIWRGPLLDKNGEPAKDPITGEPGVLLNPFEQMTFGVGKIIARFIGDEPEPEPAE